MFVFDALVIPPVVQEDKNCIPGWSGREAPIETKLGTVVDDKGAWLS